MDSSDIATLGDSLDDFDECFHYELEILMVIEIACVEGNCMTLLFCMRWMIGKNANPAFFLFGGKPRVSPSFFSTSF